MSLRDQFLSWACGLFLPVLWKMMRWTESKVRHRPYLPPKKNDGADPTPLQGPDILSALLSGPTIDTIVALDGSILWQSGQLMTSMHNIRKSGWTGEKLPKDSHIYRVFRYVLTNGPATYSLEFEGVRYSGVSWPLIKDGLIEGVVFRANPPLPTVIEKSLEDRMETMNSLVEQAKSIAGMAEARHARVAGGA